MALPRAVDSDTRARALLRHMLEHSDVVGRDHTGRTCLALYVDDRILDELASFGVEDEDAEADEDREEDDGA